MQLFKIYLFSLLIFFLTLNGEDSDLCEMLNMEVNVDFLYVTPCVDIDYAAKLKHDDTYCIQSIQPKWKPGVRAVVTFDQLCKNFDVLVCYTYFGSQFSSKIAKNQAITPYPNWGSFLGDKGKGHFCLSYHEWAALLRYTLLYNECYRLNTFFGVAGLKIHQKTKSTIFDAMDAYRRKTSADYCGAGIQAGAELFHRLSESLELFIKGSSSLLAGVGSVEDKQTSGVQEVFPSFKKKDCCQMVYGFHLGTGFLYETSLFNHDASLKLGYEFTQWDRLFELDNFGGSKTSFGFHGLTLGVGLEF